MTQRRESPRAKRAFEAYCNQEKRSLQKLSAEIGVSYSTITQWSVRYNWQERVAQYDMEVAATEREAVRKEIASRARQRMKHADALQKFGLLVMNQSKISEMTVKEARAALPTACRMIVEGMKLERLELGESTMNVQSSFTPPKPVEEMSDSELAEYIYLLEKAGAA